MEKLKSSLEEAINNLSLFLLTEDLTTEAASESVLSQLSGLEKLASQESTYAELVPASSTLASLVKSGPLPEKAQLLEAFISKALVYLQNPSAGLKFEAGTTGKIVKKNTEISDDVDKELLVEFIEKHTTALEEMEGALLDPNAPEGRGEDLKRYLKGYIHNIKGDAGSLGLHGIERSCHFIEDLIVEQGIEGLVEPLILFKEWVMDSMRAFAHNDLPKVDSEQFRMSFLRGMITGFGDLIADTSGRSESSAGDDSMDGANMDLLAELLAETGNDAPVSEEGSYELSGDKEVFVDFVVEAEEHLGIIESTLLECQGNYSKDAVDAVFRGIHSIKGASSYFKLLEISDTSHHTESLLDQVRTGKRVFDQGLTDLVFAYVDLQRNLLKRAKEAFQGTCIIERIEQTDSYKAQLAAYEKGGGLAPAPKPVPRTVKASEEPVKEEGEKEAKGEKLDIKNYIKVDTERLDQLIDSIGEMSVYSSMLIQACRQLFSDNERLMNVTHQVEKFGREMQQVGMAMRLIPIRGLFQKMSRLVWDISRKIGKDVKFKMEGEDTELDRTIIEKLADPLMHMIRNAIDHGIETPEERIAAGKGKEGRVELTAFHSGGNIHIQIKDDGKGLNPDKLVKKAIEKGIITEGQKLTEKEIYSLIFAPGFSTAAQVTDISGRGVGMDVVRRNIESIRGRVHIDSVLGEGTVFTIELPLTLAIIDGIQVTVGTENFIIPTLAVVEFMRPKKDMITMTLDRGETFHFRGKYLPIYRLGELFGIETKLTRIEDALFIIVENNGQMFAIVVDDIVSTLSTVIKSIGEMFPQGRGVAGCAIMPNGDVALILDLNSILSMARKTYQYTSNNELLQEAKKMISEGEIVQ